MRNSWTLFRYLLHFYGLGHAARVFACQQCEPFDINTLIRCSRHKLESFDLLARREM